MLLRLLDRLRRDRLRLVLLRLRRRLLLALPDLLDRRFLVHRFSARDAAHELLDLEGRLPPEERRHQEISLLLVERDELLRDLRVQLDVLDALEAFALRRKHKVLLQKIERLVRDRADGLDLSAASLVLDSVQQTLEVRERVRVCVVNEVNISESERG